MPRTKKALENEEIKVKKTNVKKTTAKKTVAKKADTKKSTTPKKTTVKKSTSTKKTTTKNTTSVKSSTAKKSTTKKVATTKTTATKKATTSKSKKSTTVKKTSKKKEILEYYDLPYTYNKTFVKILAQTPNTLFVYWEVSENDRKSFVNNFGEDFFNNTYPILIVHNKTKNYSFEIEINDFANSWYFNVNDTKCEYEIEYGRRVRNNNYSIPNNYIYIASSNEIESPNDHILFEKEQKSVFFKNTKTKHVYSKDIANLHFIKHLGNLHRIYDFYNKLYKIENLEDIDNPSSIFF